MTTSGRRGAAQVYVEGQGLQQVSETTVQPWFDESGGWPASRSCKALITDPIKEFGYPVKINHLNYGNPRYEPTGATETVDGVQYPVYRPTLDREAIQYGMAAAALMGETAYYSPGGPGGTRDVPVDDVYFVDLGKPLGEDYQSDLSRGLAWRLYENGVVVVNDGGADATLTLKPEDLPAGIRGSGTRSRGRRCRGSWRTGRCRCRSRTTWRPTAPAPPAASSRM